MGTFIHYFNSFTVYQDENGVETLVKQNNTPQEFGAYRLKVPLYGSNYLQNNGLHDWNVEVVDWLKPEVCGLCCFGDKTIRINLNYLWQLNLKQLKDLLLHEIAHALTPNHNHDEVWRQKAIEIGCNGLQFQKSTLRKVQLADGRTVYVNDFPDD